MDLLQPGLPKHVLRQARSTNTISFRLVEQMRQLNEKTNTYLASSGPDGSESGNSAHYGDTVAGIFTDFYYVVQINANGKLSAVPEVSIKKLKAFQERLSKCEPKNDFERGLVLILDEYTRLVALHHLANSILYKTIEAKSHLAYWSRMKFSTYGKIVYGVQSLPQKTYHIFVNGVRNAVAVKEEPRGDNWLIFPPLTLLVASFRELFKASWLKLNSNFIIRQARFSAIRLPLSFLDEDVKAKIALLKAELNSQYQVLGVFLNNLPITESSLLQILPSLKPGDSVLRQLEKIEDFIQEQNARSLAPPPSALTRYWPLLLLLVHYGPKLSLNAWQNRDAIADWIRLNLVDTVVGFWSNWIVKPISDMLSILRNDETMAIALKESLKTDIESLERMVADYLADTTSSKVDTEEVSKAVKQGDLTMVMSQYEDELRTPYKSIIKGLLIRSILIQVQKTKVDGDLAISGIDKLLKLQQLLLGVLSILPSLFILYEAKKAFSKDSALTQSVIDRRVDCLKSMNQINRLVNREENDDKYVSDGKLFVEVVNLNLLSHQIIPKSLRDEFLQDLNQLALASSDDHTESQAAVARIWSMYSPFFRK